MCYKKKYKKLKKYIKEEIDAIYNEIDEHNGYGWDERDEYYAKAKQLKKILKVMKTL